MAHDDSRSPRERDEGFAPDPSTIGTGGPGFAPDFAGAPSGRTEFVQARPAGNLTAPSRNGLEQVTLNSAEPAEASSDRSRALFEREDSGSGGPHVLNRAFSGTYPEER